ncbi:hypothetical protein [Amycolatopsis thermoflava]|uniref:hypothetical protein n=1 Tax=Amycolatopsis thermoflava TaxID=84480 RepID=UPI003D71ECEA
MMGSAELAQQPGAVRTEATAGDSPTDVSIPFWITACVRLQPPKRRDGTKITASLANAIFPAVQALIADRLRTEGSAEAPLSRDRIARRCGLGDAKKAGWLFDYLELIGFLRIHRHYAAPGRGRAVDTFTVFVRPPLNYVGPHTHAELEQALDRPDRELASILFVGETAGHAEGAGSGTFRADQGSESGTLVGETAGHAEGAGSGTFRADQGSESGTLVGETAGHAEGAGSGTILQIDRSSISEREIEGSIEPVPGGSAEPPATGWDESVVAAVRKQVRRLPWRKWAKVKLGVADYQLMAHDADQVQNAMCAAMTRDGITLEQATEVARHALAEAKGPVYVVRAFEPKKLGEWLRRLEAEPLAEDTLPLPGVAKAQVSQPKPDKQQVTESAAANPDRGEPPKRVLPACPTCEAREGEGLGGRTVVGDDGRHRPCPDCRPVAA